MGLCTPGVSIKTIWPSAAVTIPFTTCLVVCGLFVTIDTFSPTRRLRRVDLPEFGRPMIETKPDFIRYESIGGEAWSQAVVPSLRRCKEGLYYRFRFIHTFRDRRYS